MKIPCPINSLENLEQNTSYRVYILRPVQREIRESASEIKFVVDAVVGDQIRERARQLLSPDPWASGPAADEYTTTTIYFDTPDFAVYNRRGSYRRAKYRVRRYGDGRLVFLERKLRTSEMLTKRRSNVRIEDLPLLLKEAPASEWAGAWFQKRITRRELGAVCQVKYQRMARVGMTESGPIRLTVDEGLEGCPIETPDFVPADQMKPISDVTIVEMKFTGAMPALFKGVIEEFTIDACRVSKYRLAAEQTRTEIINA